MTRWWVLTREVCFLLEEVSVIRPFSRLSYIELVQLATNEKRALWTWSALLLVLERFEFMSACTRVADSYQK
jgi:hypothetical protein